METNWKPRVEAKEGLEWRQEAYRGDKSQGLERRHSGCLERRHSGGLERRHNGGLERRHSGGLERRRSGGLAGRLRGREKQYEPSRRRSMCS